VFVAQLSGTVLSRRDGPRLRFNDWTPRVDVNTIARRRLSKARSLEMEGRVTATISDVSPVSFKDTAFLVVDDTRIMTNE